MLRAKIAVRKSVTQGSRNGHYRLMFDRLHQVKGYGCIHPKDLHYDNGINELSLVETFNWAQIY